MHGRSMTHGGFHRSPKPAPTWLRDLADVLFFAGLLLTLALAAVR
jgi:hypothetical protein